MGKAHAARAGTSSGRSSIRRDGGHFTADNAREPRQKWRTEAPRAGPGGISIRPVHLEVPCCVDSPKLIQNLGLPQSALAASDRQDMRVSPCKNCAQLAR